MTLQKMDYGDGRVVCAVNLSDRGGEFTVCGNNCLDAGRDGELDDWDIIGYSFEGKLKQVTCSNCLRVISYIKSFK